MPAALVVLLPAVLLACATKRGRRFLSGRPMDGELRTDATLFGRPTRALHPTAKRSWWHWRPGWHRGAARLLSLTVTLLVAYGLLSARAATMKAFEVAVAATAGYVAWRVYRGARSWARAVTWNSARPWRSAWSALILPITHHLHYRAPLRAALTAEMGVPPARLRLPLDRSRVIVGVPAEFTGDKETEWVTRAVAAKAALESPEASPRLHGRKPVIIYTPSVPPPFPVSWEDVAPAVARAASNELVFGPGKRDVIGKANYGESPHVAAPGGSGGGKSNLIAFLVIQELLRGSLVFILDPKATSHAWAINLPGVIYCVEPHEIRMALTWIASERKRRSRNAHQSAARDGIVRARPGVRIIVVCEELNVGMPEIKAEWVALRAQDKSLPAESPAIAGLRDTACAGRACDIHAFFVAQLFNVESTGVRDSAIRSQAGIKAMLRWDEPGWAMAVGKNPPMPPPVSTPGRIQLVTGGTAREVQVPWLHLDDEDHPDIHEKSVAWARELAVSKDVAKIPTGTEGVPRELWPPCVLGQERLALPPGRSGGTPGTVPGSPPHLPPMTLSQAHAAGVYGNRKPETVRKGIQRLGDRAREPAERGSAGLPHKWTAEDHHAMAKELERR